MKHPLGHCKDDERSESRQRKPKVLYKTFK